MKTELERKTHISLWYQLISNYYCMKLRVFNWFTPELLTSSWKKQSLGRHFLSFESMWQYGNHLNSLDCSKMITQTWNKHGRIVSWVRKWLKNTYDNATWRLFKKQWIIHSKITFFLLWKRRIGNCFSVCFLSTQWKSKSMKVENAILFLYWCFEPLSFSTAEAFFFFSKYLILLHRRKSDIQVWNDMK